MTFEEVISKLNQAEEYKQRGNYEEVDRICKEILAVLASTAEEGVPIIKRKNIGSPDEQLGNCIEGNEREYLRAGTLRLLAASLYLRGIANEAFPIAEEALKTAEQAGNKHDAARAVNILGLVHSDLGDYPRALENYAKALIAHEELGMKSDAALVTGNIGTGYWRMGDYPRALEYLGKALTMNQELGMKFQAALVNASIGNVLQYMGDYLRAEEYFVTALSAHEEVGNKAGVSNVISNLGVLYSDKGDYPVSLEYFTKALDLNQEVGNKAFAATVMGNIGEVYRNIGDYPRALNYYAQGLAMSQELGNKELVSIFTGNMGSVYANKKFEGYDAAEAEEMLLKALAISEELGAKYSIFHMHKFLAELYKVEERWKDFAVHLEKFYEIEKEVQSEESKKKAVQMEQQKQIALMKKEQEVTDRLLHKTFPSPIVHRLKSGENLVVEHFDSASILFADLVGFTKLSLVISPQAMIELLNFVFTHFDTIIEHHGGHRLRTMGDGYFAIMGVPDLREDHARRMAQAALAMQKDIQLPVEISKFLPPGTEFKVRIGLNCGEVVAGLVGGLNKWQYDVYGDTVNTASRMESHGLSGKIHCTEEFVRAVGDSLFHFTERGEMEVKGKGLMKTYFLGKQ